MPSIKPVVIKSEPESPNTDTKVVNTPDKNVNLSQKQVLIRKVTLPSTYSTKKHVTVNTVTAEIKSLQGNESKVSLNSVGKTETPNNMGVIDLTSLSPREGKVNVEKIDQGVQTDTKEFETQCVQTEPSEDNLLGFDYGFLDLLTNSSVPDFSNMPDLGPTPTLAPKEQQGKEAEMFFNDLKFVFQPDEKGNMPIHVGVLSNNLNMVKRNCIVLKALQRSVDLPNNRDQVIRTATETGRLPGRNRFEGSNILHLAVEYEQKDSLATILGYALQRGTNLDQLNEEGLTPLMVCCCNKLHQCAELLLDNGADINCRDGKSGRTALFHAAENQDLEMVLLLLSYGADTKVKNFFGTSPHDAMYEIEISDDIRYAILGKSVKRKVVEESWQRAKAAKKKRKIIQEPRPLKTYARLKKIDDHKFSTNVTTSMELCGLELISRTDLAHKFSRKAAPRIESFHRTYANNVGFYFRFKICETFYKENTYISIIYKEGLSE
ncbi:hypothetical protein NQ317_018242 [Molorchus minor]|uniref:Uncharacterized protein n=1 Tax=Molorchus minor TaxID=1323400 RepID=A0ABQ9K458_9CUCU|nr:hypothetical protein NQ317_018242 [Molorchus minor]